MIKCKFCGFGGVVKKGIRRLKKGNKQIYFCKNCEHKFSLSERKSKFRNDVVIDAVNYYCLGYSGNEVVDILKRKHEVSVGNSSVYNWCKNYPYLKIRDEMSKRYGRNLVFSKIFKHDNLVYNFRFHKGKLLRFGKFDGLKRFIFNLEKGVDSEKFDSARCSQLKNNIDVNVTHNENNFLNLFVGDALKSCNSNKKRHSIVEKFMLCCDRDSVAVEVPVWYWEKGFGGISGHIDILQVKNGKVYVLDFKPNANKENFDAVVSQLFHYARALSFRTGVSLDNFRCGWFDWKDYFEFNPREARLRNE